MTILLTGAGGFVGGYLCAALRKEGADLVAIGRPGGRAEGRVDRFVGTRSIPNRTLIAETLERFQPDQVYHLAGASSASSMAEMYRVNTLYAVDLIEAARRMRRPPRVVLLGSAAEYGPPSEPGRLMCEDDPARPVSAYGISKLAQTLHGLAVSDLPVVVARLFNPIGPGMPESTAAGRFVRKAADLGRSDGVIQTGASLDAVRDFVDVADAADAMIGIGSGKVAPGRVYNLCTGLGTSMADLTSTIVALAPGKVEFRGGEADPGVRWAVGNPALLARHGIRLPVPDLRDILGRMLSAASASVSVE